MHFLYQAYQLMCTLLNYCNITNKMRQCVSSVRIRSPLHKKVYKQCVCGLFASFSEITVRILLPLPIPQQHLQAPVIRLFPLPGEKAAGEFPACAVIGDAFAAFSLAFAGIGAVASSFIRFDRAISHCLPPRLGNIRRVDCNTDKRGRRGKRASGRDPRVTCRACAARFG